MTKMKIEDRRHDGEVLHAKDLRGQRYVRTIRKVWMSDRYIAVPVMVKEGKTSVIPLDKILFVQG